MKFIEVENGIEKTIQNSVLEKLDTSIKVTLLSISIESLVLNAQKHSSENGYMFYL
ncbi:MAG: hypothetical protein LBB06_02230 [Endomicrobium sp.]|nr:hypothetical protein [Endomicrobium sp.]